MALILRYRERMCEYKKMQNDPPASLLYLVWYFLIGIGNKKKVRK